MAPEGDLAEAQKLELKAKRLYRPVAVSIKAA